MGTHLIDGEFQSDKYPGCPRGKVPLSCKDPTAQDLLWEYAQRRRAVDAEFSADLEQALKLAGFSPPDEPFRSPYSLITPGKHVFLLKASSLYHEAGPVCLLCGKPEVDWAHEGIR
jgi:hypothetical protein